MSDVIKWSGWEIRGWIMTTPRRVRLSPSEFKVLRVLIEQRIADVGKTARYLKVERIAELTGTNVASARRTIAELRSAIGRGAIETSRTHGYLLLDCSGGRNQMSPADELVVMLTNALSAAKRLQKSTREGLY